MEPNTVELEGAAAVDLLTQIACIKGNRHGIARLMSALTALTMQSTKTEETYKEVMQGLFDEAVNGETLEKAKAHGVWGDAS